MLCYATLPLPSSPQPLFLFCVCRDPAWPRKPRRVLFTGPVCGPCNLTGGADEPSVCREASACLVFLARHQ